MLSSFYKTLLLSSLLFISNQSYIFADNGILPPIKVWHGKSEQFIQSDSNPWQTPSEKTNLTDTPNYQQTYHFLKKLVASDERLQWVSIGKSPQGREIGMVVASAEGYRTATDLIKKGKPTLLVQAGIHSGEIDGKDAGMMLLRDIIKGDKGALINHVNWLFIPILSVDAHERRGLYNRVNQRGPIHMGWRTNALNLNLNRDYTKLETPELRAVIGVINRFKPTVYYDVHVTNGEDYQYDMTYGYANSFADSPNISQWFTSHFRPEMDKTLAKYGHKGGPLVFGVNPFDFSKGIVGWNATPRFSNGYGDVRHLPTILWENHSLKSYKQRVLGTYIMLMESLQILAKDSGSLKAAIKKDQRLRKPSQVVEWETDVKKPTFMDFSGVDYQKVTDPVTQIQYIKWLGKPKLYRHLPIFWMDKAKVKVQIPHSYWIPSQYHNIIKKLQLHGIKIKKHQKATLVKGVQLEVTKHQFKNPPFENRTMVQASFKKNQGSFAMPSGSIEVSTDQPLRNLIVSLLDPRAPDSLFSWGYFNAIFQRTEYIEAYALVPLSKKLFKEHPNIKKKFINKLKTDKEFAADDKKKLEWIYSHSRYYDNRYLKYPVIFVK